MSNTNKPRRTPPETQAIVERSLRRRYWAERRFRAYGFAAVTAGMAFLVYLFFVIFSNGIGAFQQTQVRLSMSTTTRRSSIPAAIAIPTTCRPRTTRR